MKKFAILIIGLLVLASCSPAAELSNKQEIEPVPTLTLVAVTNTQAPMNTEVLQAETVVPTQTEIASTPTILPEGVLFRDDFDGVLQPGWTWINEDPNRWSFVENGWLQIIGGDSSFFQQGDFGLDNFLTREVPEGEFIITTHIQSNPETDFQQAAIYLYEDQNNYIALNIGYCGPCDTSGPGFFMETFIDNNPFDDAYMVERSPEDIDVYLRLVNQAGSLTGYYAIVPGEWQRLGSFGNYFDFNSVGLGTTNSSMSGVDNDIVSRFDFFEISLP